MAEEIKINPTAYGTALSALESIREVVPKDNYQGVTSQYTGKTGAPVYGMDNIANFFSAELKPVGNSDTLGFNQFSTSGTDVVLHAQNDPQKKESLLKEMGVTDAEGVRVYAGNSKTIDITTGKETTNSQYAVAVGKDGKPLGKQAIFVDHEAPAGSPDFAKAKQVNGEISIQVIRPQGDANPETTYMVRTTNKEGNTIIQSAVHEEGKQPDINAPRSQKNSDMKEKGIKSIDVINKENKAINGELRNLLIPDNNNFTKNDVPLGNARQIQAAIPNYLKAAAAAVTGVGMALNATMQNVVQTSETFSYKIADNTQSQKINQQVGTEQTTPVQSVIRT